MFVSRYYYLNIINQNILYMWFLNVLVIVTLRNHLYVTKSKGENCQQIIFSFRYKVIILSCLANFTLCLFVVGKLQTSDILTILLMKYSFAQTCRFQLFSRIIYIWTIWSDNNIPAVTAINCCDDNDVSIDCASPELLVMSSSN